MKRVKESQIPTLTSAAVILMGLIQIHVKFLEKASIYFSGLCMKSQETFATFCRGELSNHGTHFGHLGTDP